MLKMNRHTKTALFVAPILLLLGWALMDMWMENEAQQTRFYQLTPEAGTCDVKARKCILRSGDFKLSLYLDKGRTTLNSTFPLDTATLFLVDKHDQATVYRMGMKESAYYWFQTTPLTKVLQRAGSEQKLRLVATVKGGQYIAEFISKTRP